MASQTSKKKSSSIGLSKQQVNGIIINIKDHFTTNINDIRIKIADDIFNDSTLQQEGRKSLVDTLLTQQLLTEICDSFCDIYSRNNIGNFKDKYSLLQIRWSEWISQCLLCGSSNNIRIVPDLISQRSVQKCESKDISAVLHAIAASFFEIICIVIKSIRPSKQNQAVVSPNVSKSDAGICWSLYAPHL